MFLGALLLLAACNSTPDANGINDPLEPMNRKVHAFNVGLDSHVVKPLTGGKSDDARPDDAKPGIGSRIVQGVGNFGSNLAEPGKAINHLLQGQPEPAIKTTFRFLVNTTVGLGGVLDPATADFALPEQDTDFGQTLAVWGVGEGPYLELPLLGPSTGRDAVGKVVDLVADPMGSVLNRDQRIIGFGARLAGKAAERGAHGDTIDSVLYESADSYAQTRLIWLQHRRHELGQEGEDIDPYAE